MYAYADMPKQGFGFQLGYAQPTLRLNSPEEGYPKDSLVSTIRLHGFKAGIVYDDSYIKGFGSSIGFNYTFATTNTAWTKKTSYQISDYPQHRYQMYYHQLEVFVDWQYKFEIAKETYVMLFTGPTVQYGAVFRQKEQEDSFGTVSYSGEVLDRYGKDHPNTDLKHLNVTWGVGAGFQYRRYFLRGGYDFGLINPYKNERFTAADGSTMDRNTRGRFDQWEIKLGIYLWYAD